MATIKNDRKAYSALKMLIKINQCAPLGNGLEIDSIIEKIISIL